MKYILSEVSKIMLLDGIYFVGSLQDHIIGRNIFCRKYPRLFYWMEYILSEVSKIILLDEIYFVGSLQNYGIGSLQDYVIG